MLCELYLFLKIKLLGELKKLKQLFYQWIWERINKSYLKDERKRSGKLSGEDIFQSLAIMINYI